MRGAVVQVQGEWVIPHFLIYSIPYSLMFTIFITPSHSLCTSTIFTKIFSPPLTLLDYKSRFIISIH